MSAPSSRQHLVDGRRRVRDIDRPGAVGKSSHTFTSSLGDHRRKETSLVLVQHPVGYSGSTFDRKLNDKSAKMMKNSNIPSLTLAPRHMPVLLILVCVLIISSASHTTADACASCLNGGKLLMPNNIFGFCRCQCMSSYKGPRCQFAKKKRTSISPLSMGWGSQLYGGDGDSNHGLLDEQTGAGGVRETFKLHDEAILKLLIQQLYNSQQIPFSVQDQDEENNRRRR